MASFRYPFDIQSTLSPWRDKLGEDFDGVVARLVERDRSLEDAVGFLMNKPMCRAYRTTNQLIANNTRTAVSFDAERYDTKNFRTGTSTDLVIIEAGVYNIEGQVFFDTHATGHRFADIEINGTVVIVSDSPDKRSDNYWAGNPTTQYKLAAGDVVRLVVYQTSGGNLNVLTAGNYTPELALEWVGNGA